MSFRRQPIITMGESNPKSEASQALTPEQTASLTKIGNPIDVLIHELKQPLLCILVLGERLEQVIRDLKVEQTPKAGQMKRDVAALLVSVQQMREIMSARSALANLLYVHEGWGARITSQIEALAAIASSRNMKFNYDLQVGGREAGPDLSAVGQVLSNLVNNAIQAMEDLGDTWEREKEVKVVLLEKEGNLEICVHDSGKGVTQEIASRIFDRGFTTKSGRGGSGYGLWVCRKLAEALGGSVKVTASDVLGGACFTFVVPLAAGAATEHFDEVA